MYSAPQSPSPRPVNIVVDVVRVHTEPRHVVDEGGAGVAAVHSHHLQSGLDKMVIIVIADHGKF